jgi:membrane associated rhomboid family serine protease
MIPISDDNPTLRFPIVTVVLLAVIGAAWIFAQHAGLDPLQLSVTTCNFGLVPGELTGLARPGLAVPMGRGLYCVVDREAINYLTPVTSMFLHGGWAHLLGNGIFLWVFGNNVEDSMGRGRFVVFYLVCGLAAAGAQIAIDPSSPIPMIGASGAVSGVLGAYLILYPRVRVHVFVGFFLLSLPAYLVLLIWIGMQLLSGLPQLMTLNQAVSSGVAVWAHIGGFFAGVALIKLFENPRYTRERTFVRHTNHPTHW